MKIVEFTTQKQGNKKDIVKVKIHVDFDYKNMLANDIALLKCTSSYPAPIEEANMIMIKDLAERKAKGKIVQDQENTA